MLCATWDTEVCKYQQVTSALEMYGFLKGTTGCFKEECDYGELFGNCLEFEFLFVCFRHVFQFKQGVCQAGKCSCGIRVVLAWSEHDVSEKRGKIRY